MKAIVCAQAGPPEEVLRLEEVEKPIPGEREVLIKVFAVDVTAQDPGMRGMRLGRRADARGSIPGSILAGEIDAAGQGVRRLKKGDRVFGFTGWLSLGACAEYKCMPENGVLAVMPHNMTYAEAVTIPYAGLTALPFLRDTGKIRTGQHVLVNGASGAIGVCAVQLAKYFGAEVTGVCSTGNLGMVKTLGADRVVDYTREDFARNRGAYDIIFDTVGKSSFLHCKNALKSGGVYLTTVPAPADLLKMLLTSATFGRKARFAPMGLRPAGRALKDLIFLKELAEQGRLKAFIDRTYPLERIAEAHRHVETGHKRGNVVVIVRPEAE